MQHNTTKEHDIMRKMMTTMAATMMMMIPRTYNNDNNRHRHSFLLQIMLKRVFLSIAAVVLVVTSCNAQEYPNPQLETEQFNTNISFRQNVCDRQTQYDQGSIEFLADALEGLQIHTILDRNSPYFILDDEGKISQNYPGLMAVLMDEIAKLGKFTWRNSFVTYGYNEDAQSNNKTWTDLLVWSANTYDVVADSYTINFERQNLGISFPESWFDASEVLIGLKKSGSSQQETKDDDVLNVWSFLYPFDDMVWYTILVTMVLSGLLYTFLVAIDPYSDRRKIEKKPIQAIFMSAMGFAGHMEFETQTHPARLFTFSLAMWSLLMVSAYTANLASFLVVRNTPTIPISSIEDVVRQQQPICVKSNTATAEGLKRDFPNAILIEKSNESDTYKSIFDGECTYVLTTMSKWQVYERNSEINQHCSLAWIGRVFKHREGGMATISDSGTQCTSLIRDVFSLHLLKMKHDGIIQDAWNEHLQRLETNDCASGSQYSSSSSSSSTTTSDNSDITNNNNNNNNGQRRNGRSRRRLAAVGTDSRSTRRRLAASTTGGGRSSSSSNDIAALTSEDGESLEDLRLNITNMGGIFILHGFLSVLAIIMALIHRWFGLTKRRNKERREKYLAKLEGRLMTQKEIGMLNTLSERRSYILRHMKRHKKTSGYGMLDSMVRDASVLFKNDALTAKNDDDDEDDADDESINDIDNVGSSCIFHSDQINKEEGEDDNNNESSSPLRDLYPTNNSNNNNSLEDGLSPTKNNNVLGSGTSYNSNDDAEELKKTIMILNSRQEQQMKAMDVIKTELSESRKELNEQIATLMRMVAAVPTSSAASTTDSSQRERKDECIDSQISPIRVNHLGLFAMSVTET